MADNTQGGSSTGPDTIRTVAKTVNSPAKTPMSLIDVGGGADGSPETPLVVGQAAMASSLPVAIASNQSAVPVSGTFFQATQPVSGTVTANAGTNLNTSLLALEAGGNLAAAKVDLDTLAGAVSAGKVQATVATALPAGSNVIGHVIVDSGTVTTVSTVTAVTTVTTVTTVAAVTAITNALPAGENHLGEVAGNTSQVLVTITRPSDTNAYAALDSVNTSTSAPTIITFTNAMRVTGASGYVTLVKLLTDQSTNVARLRLHLFNVNNPTLPNDNAAYAMKWADRAGYLGAIDLPAFATEGTGSDCARTENAGNLLAVKAAGGDRNLYGLLETLDAFTPTSAQNFHLELATESN